MYLSKKYKLSTFLGFLVFIFFVTTDLSAEDSLITRDFALIKYDYKNFYLDGKNLIKLGIGVSGAGILANTSIDGDIQKYYQDHIRDESIDSMSKILKTPGEVFFTIPLLIGTRFFLKDTPAGEWAQKSLRAMIAGAPAGLVMQRATGASRPSEGNSKWKPFKDGNGLSGHAFVGAVLFITAARMNDDPYLKGIFYGLSILPGLSRINDNKHYFSQIASGWYLAFLSCNAVDKTDHKNKTTFLITPLSGKGVAVLISRGF